MSPIGYAITAHKTQGLTTEQAWVLGSYAVYREWGYVALSRARHATHLYVFNDEPSGDLDLHGAAEAAKPVTEQLANDLGRSRGQHLAVDQAAAESKPTAATGSTSRRSPSAAATRLRLLLHERDQAAHQLASAEQRLVDATAYQDGRSVFRRVVNRSESRQTRMELVRLRGNVDAWRRRLADLDAELTETRQVLANYADRSTPDQRREASTARTFEREKSRIGDRDLDLGIA